MQKLQKFWRDRAFDIHRIIKAQDLPISRDYPAEIFGAFLTYFTRQELLDSQYGDSLMDLLQHDFAYKPYVILDDDLGVKRIANLLRIPTKQAAQLAPLFIQAFEALAPGQVFRSEQQFVRDVVQPRIEQAMKASPEFVGAFSALESDHIRLNIDTWENSDELLRDLPHGVPMDREDIEELRKLRDDKSDTWHFRQVFELHPADAAGNVLNHKFASWCEVRVDFEKLDRAILAGGEYSANVYGAVARAWTAGGPFDNISRPDTHISIEF